MGFLVWSAQAGRADTAKIRVSPAGSQQASDQTAGIGSRPAGQSNLCAPIRPQRQSLALVNNDTASPPMACKWWRIGHSSIA